MRIVANTSGIPNEKWAEYIRFCRPNGVNLDGWVFQIQRRNGPGTSGRAFSWRKKIFLRVGEPRTDGRPYRRRADNGYLASVCYTYEESVLHVLAHELRHAWQYQNPNGRRVWGSRSKTSERDADAYAIHVVREWRRSKPAEKKAAPTPAPVPAAAAVKEVPKVTKPRVDFVLKRAEHARKMLDRWERKLKLAKTMRQKWARKAGYYDRKAATPRP